jgi:hypothetical protein
MVFAQLTMAHLAGTSADVHGRYTHAYSYAFFDHVAGIRFQIDLQPLAFFPVSNHRLVHPFVVRVDLPHTRNAVVSVESQSVRRDVVALPQMLKRDLVRLGAERRTTFGDEDGSDMGRPTWELEYAIR